MDTFISKKRGALLTFIIFINSIGLALSLLNTDTTTVYSPSWLLIDQSTVDKLSVLLTIAFLWNIWLWKKWALYSKIVLDAMMAVYGVIIFIYNATNFHNLSLPIALAFSSFIVLYFILWDGLLFWAAKRKWRYFS